MAARGQAMTVEFHAWDTSANSPKTGDASNITLRWIKDGTSAALTTTTVTEVDSTNAKGVYKCSLSSTETDCLLGKLAGVSSTANVAIFGPTITFDQIPTAAAGASGGLPTVDASNAVKVQSGTGANQISLSSGLVRLSATGVDDILDEALSGHTTAGTLGKAVSDINSAVDTEVAAIKAKTDNLPSDPADESLIIAATDALATSIAALNNLSEADIRTAVGLASANLDTQLGDIPTATENADALLKRDWTSVTGEAARSALNALRGLRNKVSRSGATLTVTKEDDSTSAWTATLTTDASAEPVTSQDPA